MRVSCRYVLLQRAKMKTCFLIVTLWFIADWSYAQSAAKAVGVLRADGIVVPVAIFQGSNMRNISEKDLLALRDNRPNWYLMSDTTVVIQISTMVMYDPYSMETGTGFISSAISESIKNYDENVRGVVYTWQPPVVGEFQTHNDVDQSRNDFAQEIDRQFRAAELMDIEGGHRRTIDGVEYANNIPVEARLRDSLGIEKTVYSTALSGKSLHYVIAQRWYPKTGCQFKAVFEAWMEEEPYKTPSIVQAFFDTGVCDAKSLAGSSYPIQAFEVNGKRYAVIQSWGYEGGGYTVLQLERNDYKFFYQN